MIRQLVRHMRQWRSVAGARRWLSCGAARPDSPPKASLGSRTCPMSFPGKARSPMSLPLSSIAFHLTPEMQSTRQQKKYFSSVSPQRKILMGHTFSRVSDEGLIYVDKTPFIKRLVKVFHPGSGVFVNRPRRFGKSLLVSTLEEYFKGNKEAFKGTEIYNDPEVEWEKRPVIKLDMSEVGGSTIEKVESSLVDLLLDVADNKGVEISTPGYPPNPISMIRRLLQKTYAKEGKELVVLIDEYDSPIVSKWAKDKVELAEACQEFLSDIYRQLKASSPIIQFRFLTGISYLSKIGIDSGLNDLTDIDEYPDLGAILGFTREEVTSTYSPEIKVIAKELEMNEEELMDEITRYYDGYNWGDDNLPATQVYHPHSVNKFFTLKKFGYYSTGWPTLLRRVVDSVDFVRFSELLSGEVPSRSDTPQSLLSLQNPTDSQMRLLLWELGILQRRPSVTMGSGVCFTNEGARQHFTEHVLRYLYEDESTSTTMREMRIALITGDIPKFAETFATVVEGIPANVTKWKDGEGEAMREKEGFYQSIYISAINIFGPSSSYLGSEEVLEGGVGPDLVFISPQCAMIFEFQKNPKRVDEGLKQIKKQEYIEKYGKYLEKRMKKEKNSEQVKKWEKRLERWKSVPKWGIGINVIVDEGKKTVTKTTSIAEEFPFSSDL